MNTYFFSTVFTTRASLAKVLISHPYISSSLCVKVIFAIGNHWNIQTKDCCPELAHCISITLVLRCRFTLWILLLEQIIEFWEILCRSQYQAPPFKQYAVVSELGKKSKQCNKTQTFRCILQKIMKHTKILMYTYTYEDIDLRFQMPKYFAKL